MLQIGGQILLIQLLTWGFFDVSLGRDLVDALSLELFKVRFDNWARFWATWPSCLPMFKGPFQTKLLHDSMIL